VTDVVRMINPMFPVPCAQSVIMLKLMKHRVIWSLLLYWRHSTCLGKLHLCDIFGEIFVLIGIGC